MTIQTPIPDFAAARLAMVESQLRPQGVSDLRVIEAMGSVPREQFVPADLRPLAYVDRALPLGGGRFLPAPATLGQLLTEMMAEPGTRALVVGSATGYAVAVLKAMGLEVTAVESDPALAERAEELGIATVEAPLEEGYAGGAPYTQILINGAVEIIPEAIIAQLADGGRLGTALIDRGVTRLVVGRKIAGAFGYLSISDAGVPALPGFSRPKEFIF